MSLINRMAQYFQVSLADLITRDLANGLPPQKKTPLIASSPTSHPGLDPESLSRLEERTQEMRKMLEGFRVFYQQRQKNIQQAARPIANGSGNDVENFLIFIDQVISYNEQIFDFLRRSGLLQEAKIPERRAS